MIYLELFFSFLKIGFSSFGGLSMVPVINAEMLSHGWMTQEQVIDIIAIAEMTPGPLGLNSATFAGIQVAGIPGALAANFGVLMPTLTLTLLAAIFFERFRKSRGLANIMDGVRPVCFGLIAAVFLTMLDGTVIQAGMLHWQSLVIALVGAVLMLKWKWGVPRVIAVSAVLGLILVR